jgi:ABC-type protease/lipase transport system fused ATPase/permease subunit
LERALPAPAGRDETPDLLLLDERTSNLDADGCKAVKTSCDQRGNLAQM